MASYIYMQNLNEISQIIFSILYVKIKKNLKLNIILLFMGVYGHLNIGHTLNTSYNHMPNLNESINLLLRYCLEMEKLKINISMLLVGV